jgi:hypothetical protein
MGKVLAADYYLLFFLEEVDQEEKKFECIFYLFLEMIK